MDNKRKLYADYLRIFATVAVVLIHISIQGRDASEIASNDWVLFNIFCSAVRWAVPIFLMLSGSLFLGRDIPIKKVYSKYIFRLVCAFVSWNIIYLFLSKDTIQHGIMYRILDQPSDLIKGHYHMWFLIMIIGMYMGMPIYRKIVSDRKILKYFLILAAVFSIIIPWCIQIVEDTVSVSFIIKMTRVLKEVLTTMSLDVIMGYSFYYLLGYFLDDIVISKSTRRLIYLLGVTGFIVTAVLEWIVAIKTNEPHQHYYNNFSVNVALEAIAVFTWFKYHDFKITKLHGVIETISKYCFGAYLVHALIIEIFEWPLGITAISFYPPVAVLIMGTMVFASSIIISAILNHIPYVGKYLV